MMTYPLQTVRGYQLFEATPDLSRLETGERLSQSTVDGFFAIMDKWRIEMSHLPAAASSVQQTPQLVQSWNALPDYILKWRFAHEQRIVIRLAHPAIC